MAFERVSPLDWSTPIVDPETGKPTSQFIRLWQQMFGNGDTLNNGKVDATTQVIAGDGLDGGGALSGDVTLTADVQEILDQLSTTRGTVIYRGASGWTTLNPGTTGHFLKTSGTGTDPSWAAATADIQTLLDGISTTQGVIIYYNGTDWVSLNPGTSGYLLATGGAGANPSWTAPPSGNIQTLLDGISTTQGVLLYYNGTDWVALSPGTNGFLLQSGGAGANPSWVAAPSGNIQTLLDGISTTQGVVLYYNGTDWVALPVGTAGQVLTTGGSGANPSWAAAGTGAGGSYIGVKAYSNTTQNITNSTVTVAALNSEEFDSGTMHDNTTNNSRLVAPYTGKYLVTYMVNWDTNITGARIAFIRKNAAGAGTDADNVIGATVRGEATTTTPCNVNSIEVSLTAGDYLELYLYQDSGTTRTIGASGAGNQGSFTKFSMTLINSGIGQGTSFPSSPATNTRFFRTDRGIEYYYDGTRWLSTQLFTSDMSTSENAAASVATCGRLPVPHKGVYDIYLVDMSATMFIFGGGNWSIGLRYTTAANTQSTITTVTSTATSTWDNQRATIGSVLSATAYELEFFITKTSGGGFYSGAMFTYRLVG